MISIQYNTIKYNTKYSTAQYNTIQYNTIQYNTKYSTAQYNTIQYKAKQNKKVLLPQHIGIFDSCIDY